MDIIIGVLIALLGLVLVVIIKLSTTLFHELGHALPALFFTNKNVEVYVGSYGDLSNSLNLNFGRLKISLKWNIFDWKLGLCRQEESASNLWQEILILLGGPIASLLISIPIILNIKSFEPNSLLLFVGIVFIGAATYDFIINIIPISKPIKMHDGSFAYCDGYALLSIYRRIKSPPEFFELESKFRAKEYKDVIEMGQSFLATNPDKRFVYDFIIKSLNKLNNQQEALKYYMQLGEHAKLEDEDHFEIGKLYKSIGNFSEALKHFEIYWYKNYSNVELLNEISQAQIELGNSEVALQTLNSLMNIESNNQLSYLLRARAYINTNNYDLAEKDLKFSQELKSDDPYMFYLLGILYEKTNRFNESLQSFLRAKELKCNQSNLEFKIETVKSQI